ncbi:MAG TPA: CDGSH iron-sulfur domain-containing protein [Burkholderiales bacterium]
MARLVKRTATGPYKIDASTDAQFICGCGLSRNQPFCDGTHKTTARTEDAAKLFWYDADGNRHECADAYPGIRSA